MGLALMGKNQFTYLLSLYYKFLKEAIMFSIF